MADDEIDNEVSSGDEEQVHAPRKSKKQKVTKKPERNMIFEFEGDEVFIEHPS